MTEIATLLRGAPEPLLRFASRRSCRTLRHASEMRKPLRCALRAQPPSVRIRRPQSRRREKPGSAATLMRRCLPHTHCRRESMQRSQQLQRRRLRMAGASPLALSLRICAVRGRCVLAHAGIGGRATAYGPDVEGSACAGEGAAARFSLRNRRRRRFLPSVLRGSSSASACTTVRVPGTGS